MPSGLTAQLGRRLAERAAVSSDRRVVAATTRDLQSAQCS